MPDYVLGIDLGTTTSCVASLNLETNEVTLLPLELDGQPKTASVVFYDGNQPGTVLLGKTALAMLEEDDARRSAVLNVKRHLGERVLFAVGEDKMLAPTDVIADMLRTLKGKAEYQLFRDGSQKVSRVVLTHPAVFDECELSRYREAIERAGFDPRQVRFVPEPVAAALAIEASNGQQVRELGEWVLVYDLGGGTCDLALLRRVNGTWQVVKTDGVRVGGSLFDERVYEHWQSEAAAALAEQNQGAQIDTRGSRVPEILEACRETKELLSEVEEHPKRFFWPTTTGPFRHSHRLSKAQFNELIRDDVDETIRCVEQLIQSVPEAQGNVRDVILIGGATRVPLVRQRLGDLKLTPAQHLETDTAVARGAACFARPPKLLSAPFDEAQAASARREWSKYLGIPGRCEIVLNQDDTKRVTLAMALIPPGDYTRGAPASEKDSWNDERPTHRVRISKPFYVGVHPVTQQQFQAVMGFNPSWFQRHGGGNDRVSELCTALFPVDCLTWFDAIEFCNKLSDLAGLKQYYQLQVMSRVPASDKNVIETVSTQIAAMDVPIQPSSIQTATVTISGGPGYRLLTEAEWEYVCRAGTTSPFWFGSANNAQQANIDGNIPYGTETKGTYLQRPTPVGSYSANPFDLFDVHGNVWEWCFDAYNANACAPLAANAINVDPRCDTSPKPAGPSRVLRGGSWYNSARYSRSADRSCYAPDTRCSYFGFRVARTS